MEKVVEYFEEGGDLYSKMKGYLELYFGQEETPEGGGMKRNGY